MEDRPLKSGGGYNINWDEIDEMTDPFQGKSTGNLVSKSPTTLVPPKSPVTPKGDEPSSETKKPSSPPAKSSTLEDTSDSPSKTTPQTRAAITKQATAKTTTVPNGLQNGKPQNASPSSENLKVPTDLETDEFPQPSPHCGPSPEQLAKALESVALKSSEANDSDHTNSAPDAEASSNSKNTSNEAPDGQSTPPLARIDSSTRPASPAKASALWNQLSMEVEPSRLASGVPVTEDEITSLRKERDELVTTIDEMRRCIAEYDRSLQHMIEEKMQTQPQVNVSVADLISERDQAVEEVATIEKAFGDLHRRFEKSKQVIESFKQNEEALKRNIEEYKNLLERQEKKYLALKKLAEDKLLKASQDAETQRQEFESHATRLQAALRIAELQTKSLESQLAQKTRENVELTKICDELLSKYGGLT